MRTQGPDNTLIVPNADAHRLKRIHYHATPYNNSVCSRIVHLDVHCCYCLDKTARSSSKNFNEFPCVKSCVKESAGTPRSRASAGCFARRSLCKCSAVANNYLPTFIAFTGLSIKTAIPLTASTNVEVSSMQIVCAITVLGLNVWISKLMLLFGIFLRLVCSVNRRSGVFCFSKACLLNSFLILWLSFVCVCWELHTMFVDLLILWS